MRDILISSPNMNMINTGCIKLIFIENSKRDSNENDCQFIEDKE